VQKHERDMKGLRKLDTNIGGCLRRLLKIGWDENPLL
jgi:hypothetical protein